MRFAYNGIYLQAFEVNKIDIILERIFRIAFVDGTFNMLVILL